MGLKSLKKGQFIELDAIIAIALLIAGLVYITTLFLSPSNVSFLEKYSSDAADYLKNTKVKDLPPEIRSQLSKLYYNPENSLAKQISVYLIKENELPFGDSETSIKAILKYLDSSIPENLGYRLEFGDKVFTRDNKDISLAKDISTSKTMITGLSKDDPVEGKLVNLRLRNAQGLVTEYIFFGGFTGQGNITYNLDMPKFDNIHEFYVEGSFGGNIFVFLNKSKESCETLCSDPLECPEDCKRDLRIFATDASYDGNLGGIEGADMKCHLDSANPDRSRTWKALLGAPNRKISSENWILDIDSDYVKADELNNIGTTDNNGWLTFDLDHSIDTDTKETWTGLDGFGDKDYNCDDWTSSDSGDTASYGVSDKSTVQSINNGFRNCDSELHLYCAEQLENDYCGSLTVSDPGDFSSGVFGTCKDKLIEGNNTITIVFNNTEFENQYIGGGFIRIKYYSDTYTKHKTSKIRKYLPEIDGLINLYDSIHVPGKLKKITVYLAYKNNLLAKKFFNIAGKRIYSYDPSELGYVEQKIVIPDEVSIDYTPFVEDDFDVEGSLSLTTLPFVLSTDSPEADAVDIVLVTDMSNSMQECMDEKGDPVAIDDDKAVLHYDFNEPGAVDDLTGNGFDGIVSGATYVANAGRDGNDGAYYFDGTDYIKVNKDNIYFENITMTNYNDFSVELWFKSEYDKNWPPSRLIQSIGNITTPPDDRGYAMDLLKTSINAYTKSKSTVGRGYTWNKFVGLYEGKTFNDGNYHHAVWTRAIENHPVSGDPKEIYRFYIDGELVDESYYYVRSITPSLSLLAKDSSLFIGSGVSGFKGYLDDLAIYPKALSYDDVQMNYQGYVDDCPGIVLPECVDPEDVPDDYAVYYPFDGNTEDSSSNGLDGAIVGEASYVPGIKGQAIYFSGGSGDYVDCGNDPILNPSGELTISAWFKTDSTENYRALVTKDKPQLQYWTGLHVGKLSAGVDKDGDGSSFSQAFGSKVTNTGEWHHYAMVYDGAEIRLYLDGSSTNPLTYPFPIYSSDSPHLIIGQSLRWTYNYWQGAIDDVKIYNRALNIHELDSIYREYDSDCLPDIPSECSVEDDALVAHYKFDDLSTPTLFTDSANGNYASCSLDSCPVIMDRGKYKGSIVMDGYNDYLTAPDQPWLDMADSLTISAWIKRKANDKYYIVEKGKDDSDNYAFYLSDRYGRLGFEYQGASGLHKIEASDTRLVAEGLWRHVAVVLNKNTNTITFFLDGTAVGTPIPITEGMLANNYPLIIGSGKYDGTSRYFMGVIDDLRIYDKALTPEQIQQVYNNRDICLLQSYLTCNQECPDVSCEEWEDDDSARYCTETMPEQFFEIGYDTTTNNGFWDPFSCVYGSTTACSSLPSYPVTTALLDPTYVDKYDGSSCWPWNHDSWLGEHIQFPFEGCEDAFDGTCPESHPYNYPPFYSYDTIYSSSCLPGQCDFGPHISLGDCLAPQERPTCHISLCSAPYDNSQVSTVISDWIPYTQDCTNEGCDWNERYTNYMDPGGEGVCNAGWEECNIDQYCYAHGIYPASGVCCCEVATKEKQCLTETETCCEEVNDRECRSYFNYCTEGERCYTPGGFDCCSYDCVPTSINEVENCDEGFDPDIPDYIDNTCNSVKCQKSERECVSCNNVKQKLAKKLDKTFVQNIVEASSLHRISLIDYGSEAIVADLSADPSSVNGFSSDLSALDNAIDKFSAQKGQTCISCSIQKTIDQFNSLGNTGRYKYMILMSDGEANCLLNGNCGPSYEASAEDEAVAKACEAKNDHGINIFAIGFGLSSDTMKRMRDECGATYFGATQPEDLEQIYDLIVSIILSNIQQNKALTTEDNMDILYPESYVEIEYEPVEDFDPGFGKIPLTQEKQFTDCKDNVKFNDGDVIDDIFLVGYSGNYWIGNLTVECDSGECDPAAEKNIYTAYEIPENAITLSYGDPYKIFIPRKSKKAGNEIGLLSDMSDSDREFDLKYFDIQRTDAPTATMDCSKNKLIYDAYLDLFVSGYSYIGEEADGCIWKIDTPKGLLELTIPKDSTSSSECRYKSIFGVPDIYIANEDDVTQTTFRDLMDIMDVDDDGVIDYYIDIDSFDFDVETIESVPYMWGPGIMVVSVWIE